MRTQTPCVILLTAHLIKYNQRLLASRVNAGPTAETRRYQQVIQSVASLLFIALFVVSGLDFRFHWSQVPLAVTVISEGMVALSFVVVFLVVRENSFASAVIEVSDRQEVISSGPYRVVRHPMYAGGSLLVLFSPLALGSLVAVPVSLLLTSVIGVRLIEEEKFLAESLLGYKEYCQKVRYRLVPFIW
jgi:protein-S-isoprenylcysteine O-methyltransferase Ste14